MPGRESSGFDAKPGEEIGCEGGADAVPTGTAAVPVGCQPAGDEGDRDADAGYAGSDVRPAASPVPGGGTLVFPTRNGSELGA